MYVPNRADRRYEALISGDLRFCGGKSAPAPPDYASAAEKTAAGNKEMLDLQTAANRPDQYSPFGASEWVKDDDGNWTQTTSLNPDSQRALDAELRLQGDKSELGAGMIGRLQEDFKDPMDFSSLPAWGDVAQAGDLQPGDVPQGGNVGTTAIQAGNLSPEELQRSVDFSGAEQRTSADEIRKQSEDAIYGHATSRLDPQWENRSEEKMAQLVAQGLRPGDKAYDKEMENMGRERTDAYQQAQYGAFMGGGEEAQRQQGMQLAGRGQDMSQTMQEGNFGNMATAQTFEQQERINAQNFGQQQTAAQQNYMQELMSQGQSFDQASQAAATKFGQEAQAGGQNFQQQSAQSQQQSQLRNAQLVEEMQKRGMSLNEINAIISGQQVGMPSMPGFNEAGYTSGADYSGAARDQYSGELDQFSADQAMMQSIMAGASGMGSSAIMMCDRRLKQNIKRIGSFKQYPLYVFQYLWGQWAVGVMADEVNQDAVIDINGFAAVDYARIA